jgi:hypothetical protein
MYVIILFYSFAWAIFPCNFVYNTVKVETEWSRDFLTGKTCEILPIFEKKVKQIWRLSYLTCKM